MKTLLAQADGLELWQEPQTDGRRPHRPIMTYRVQDTQGSRTRLFVTKKEAMRYFKASSAEYCVKENTLWDSAKICSIIVRK
jgi:hypothetical protein